MKPLLLIGTLALAACSDISAPPILRPTRVAPQMFDNLKFPFSTFMQSCGGELVQITGETHLKFQMTTPASGSLMAKFSIEQSFSGIGLESGLKYQGFTKYGDHEIYAGATNFTLTATSHLVGQGKATDTEIDQKVAFKIAGNGETTQETVEYKPRCN